MNIHRALSAPQFDAQSLYELEQAYPESPIKLRHGFTSHPLLERDALAQMAEALPAASVEYNRGDVPTGLGDQPAPSNGLSIGETIRRIEDANSWAVLKNIEQVPAYAALLEELLAEVRSVAEPRTGAMQCLQGFIFVSSPGSMTPYHFDPEHNILLQLQGSKTMTVFPAGDPRLAPAQVHEAYHAGGGRNLIWDEAFLPMGQAFTLDPGEAIFVPVMAPHFVRNGPVASLSLSITWRSDWSFAEAEARRMNGWLRAHGVNPREPERWPGQNRAKSLAWRAMRRLAMVE